MTPYGTAFIVIGVVGVLLIFVGILFTVFVGLLRYVPAHWFAKPTAGRPPNLYICSFCGKSHAEVRKLVAGPGVNICNNCIIVCKNLLDKELNEESRS